MEATKTICYNPATGDVLGQSDLHDEKILQNMLASARKAQLVWADIPVRRRCKIIKKIGSYLVENAEELAELISRDNGKTQTDALVTEIFPSIMATSYFTRKAPSFLADERIKAGTLPLFYKRMKITRVPWGVIGVISPWNYPLSIPFFEVIMGLLAGNAVILKTATETQWTGMALKKVIDSAALPDGLFHFINLPGRIAGKAFLDNGIDKLFFTGSVKVGRELMTHAGKTLTPVSLELGGNDPMIVLNDADLFRAVKCVIWAGFQNCGQSCGSIERIYVQDEIYDAFISKLGDTLSGINVNVGSDLYADMAAMTTDRQIDLVQSHIDQAIKYGAKILARSEIPDNPALKNLIPATALVDVTHEMEIMREETFGPVVGIMKFNKIEEAVRLANDSQYGLTASVWTKNQRTGESVGRQLQAGVVTINDHLLSHGMPETPWGGFKDSGIGRCHGKIGFDEMTQPRLLMHEGLPLKRNLWWQPYSPDFYKMLSSFIRCLYHPNRLKRFGLIALIPRMLPRYFRD